ncbi:chemotaxis protein CheB [Pseudoduganella violacea]|uniref:PAS domain S-box-containing protein n=1 Tax=Pseudoduganella violacea TaxID=1715466 RepID=A0A7W5FSJ7_9BURK|nr:chemotaxis protein CheB [Pseudoduganella violacea]MBB3117293.1 PAS domain S-box-containing protein [Pseudoduganella violacea]
MPGHSRDIVSKQAPLVAIGGSAGSLDALIQFFEVLPEDCGIAFIVVVHLSPNEESLLPELLQRRCALKVIHARNNQHIFANHVYVIPPGRILTRQQDSLQVAPLDLQHGRVAVIDVLFESLAVPDHPPLAGILLSGADSDGTAGLRRIKQAGGLTLVQNPADAAQEIMPRAAIDSGCVDAVLSAGQMPALLLSSFGINATLRRPPALQALKTKHLLKPTDKEAELVHKAVQSLRRRTGRDFSYFRQIVVLRHLRRRMEITVQGKAADYLALLDTDAAEPEALLRELLISVTGFFRDPEAFDALRRHIPELFKGKGEADFVRVWVPACATGEEAYSIAMLLQEYAETLLHPPGIRVFGCDLDRSAIEKARAGLYRPVVAASVGEERLERFFLREAGGYRVRRELRQIMLFAENDVVGDPAFTCIDLVSCRNLLIYLNPEGQKRMMDVFDFALDPHGMLFLGAAEGLLNFNTAFYPLESRYRIYRRSTDPQRKTSGGGSIQRSLTMEQSAYGQAALPRKEREGPTLNQLQDQLKLLQQRLLGSVRPETAGATAQQQLQVITQELHATLEELDIHRQELRSMNAELTAVNLVLSTKLDELEQINSDLNNHMNAAAIPMVFLNRELRIMRYTPRALDLFRLIPADIGRMLSDLRNDLDYPALPSDAEHVLNGGDPIEREIRGQAGTCYFARVLPYHAQQKRIVGVVLTFFDITERKQSEAALQASEEKLRTFISATSEIVYEMSADWLEMRSLDGKNFIATTEIPRKDWIEEYIPEDEKPRVWAAIKQATAEHGYFELEHRVVRIDGSTGWVFSRAIPLFDQQGHIAKWFGTASDITERKCTEEALHDSEEQYRKLFDAIDEGFCIIEVLFDGDDKPVDYRFLQINPAVERQAGIKEPTGRWMREIAPRHEQYWFETYGRVVQTGEPVRFESEAKELGRFFDVYAFRVGDPKLRRVGILFNDISTRKRSDDALRAEESRLRLALDAAEMGCYAWYPAEDRTEADAMLLALFGLPADAALTHASAAAMIHPDDLERHEAVLRRALDPGSDGIFRDEIRVRGADGVERWLAFNGKVEFGGEPRQPVRLSGVARDVTEQRRAVPACGAKDREHP